MKETYYAIRIGDPRRHTTYFMVHSDITPVLWKTRREAQERLGMLNNKTAMKVVRVFVTTKP